MDTIFWLVLGLGMVAVGFIGRRYYNDQLMRIPRAAMRVGKVWGEKTNQYILLRALNSFFYLTGMAVTLVALIWGFTQLFKPEIPVSDPVVNITTAPDNILEPDKILRLANVQRRAHGLEPLNSDPALTAVAQARADDMAARQYYAHKTPDGLYYYDFFPQYGIKADYTCENLDVEFTTDEGRYVNDWLRSNKGHRECLLNERVRTAGYAMALFGDEPGGKIYVVVAIHATDLQGTEGVSTEVEAPTQ